MADNTVVLFYIDGPMAGVRKTVDEITFNEWGGHQTVYIPEKPLMPMQVRQLVERGEALLTCKQVIYYAVRLPPLKYAYLSQAYAMLQK
jgi:hypothetical protein